jgi:hypothetical protein
MSATFLLKLYSLTKTEKYKESALNAIHAVQKNIMPIGDGNILKPIGLAAAFLIHR